MLSLSREEAALLSQMRSLRHSLKPQTGRDYIVALLTTAFFMTIGVISLVKLGAHAFDIQIPKVTFPILWHSIGLYDRYIKGIVEAFTNAVPPLQGLNWLHYPVAVYFALAGSRTRSAVALLRDDREIIKDNPDKLFEVIKSSADSQGRDSVGAIKRAIRVQKSGWYRTWLLTYNSYVEMVPILARNINLVLFAGSPAARANGLKTVRGFLFDIGFMTSVALTILLIVALNLPDALVLFLIGLIIYFVFSRAGLLAKAA